MLDDMDVDFGTELPGGDAFEDVKGLLEHAVREMSSEEVLLADGLTLMDSMSAFEIGEPRMDSGMLVEGDEHPPFDPLAPLLPEEICWIIDRSFACEMGWHAGNTLSQTVYTLLYVHSLQDINPDLLGSQYFYENDPKRPMQLITLVLRPAIFALLKSCDLAWREMSKKRIHDMEDWQSEKYEVSILEGVPVDMILRKLDEAYTWLRDAKLPLQWVDAIGDRLALRKTLLQLFNTSHAGDLDDLRPLTVICRNILRKVRTHLPETPAADSPAAVAFDPRVTRQLPTVMPTRELELLPQAVVWDEIERMLDSWDNVGRLRENHSLSTWQINGSLCACLPNKRLPPSYIRSLTQRVFVDNHIVLGGYPEEWLVEQFFWETLGISYESICEILINTWAGPGTLMLQEMESHLIEILTGYIRSFWFNAPRRRRNLMKSMSDWQLFQDAFVNLTSHLVVSSPQAKQIVQMLPAAAASWKFTIAREIVFSGFQQELYAAYERPLAYWCIVKLLERHLETLENLKTAIPSNSFARYEIEYQLQTLAVLQMMSIALFKLTSHEVLPSPERMNLNFQRRYKWLCAAREDDPDALLFPFPPLSEFFAEIETVREMDSLAQDQLNIARDALSPLCQTDLGDDSQSEEAEGRRDFVEHIERVNEKLLEFVKGDHAQMKLQWDPAYHPWFPNIVQQ